MVNNREGGPDMESVASNTEKELRRQGDDIVSLLRHPEISQLISDADISAAEQDLIQEINTADDFIAKPPQRQQELWTIYNKLRTAQRSY